MVVPVPVFLSSTYTIHHFCYVSLQFLPHKRQVIHPWLLTMTMVMWLPWVNSNGANVVPLLRLGIGKPSVFLLALLCFCHCHEEDCLGYPTCPKEMRDTQSRAAPQPSQPWDGSLSQPTDACVSLAKVRPHIHEL